MTSSTLRHVNMPQGNFTSSAAALEPGFRNHYFISTFPHESDIARLNLLRNLEDLHNQQERLLSSLSTELYKAADELRTAAELHRNHSGFVRYRVWLQRQAPDQLSRRTEFENSQHFTDFKDIRSEIQGLTAARDEIVRKTVHVQSILRQVVGVHVDTGSTSVTSSASTYTVYERPTEKSSWPEINVQMQIGTNNANRQNPCDQKSKSIRELIYQDGHRLEDLASPDECPDDGGQWQYSLDGSDNERPPTHSPFSGHGDSLDSTDLDAGLSDGPKALEKSDSDYNSTNTILRYFQPRKKRRILPPRSCNEGAESREIKEDVSDNAKRSKNKQKTKGSDDQHSNCGVRSSTIQAAAHRISDIRTGLIRQKEARVMERGESRLSGCE